MEWLALVVLLGLAGPLLAMPRRFAIPVALGELIIGAVFGTSGFDLIPHQEPILQTFAAIGFALVMMMVASHIDLGRFATSDVLLPALRNLLLTVLVGSGLAWLICQQLGFNQVGLIAILFFSSSAAVIFPAIADRKTLPQHSVFLAQVAFADLLAIVALPVVLSGTDGLRTAVGALLISALAVVAFFLLRQADRAGTWKRLRKLSRERRFGLELRIALLLLLAAASLARQLSVSIMIAGVAVGLAIGANGFPRRLSKQLFAVSEGFFAPVFFVMLGAAIDVRAVFQQSDLLTLALLLAIGALVVHLTPMLFGIPPRYAFASVAQLGIPAAAVQLGQASGLLSAGQSAAIMLAAVATLLVTTFAVAGLESRVPKRDVK